ncbi:endopeptidase La [Candidatus Dependentiae bacterium]|jgi:ATP-dependent Lon protease|nr:endopeptidase La [Candidatus Dependentiae bacterium]
MDNKNQHDFVSQEQIPLVIPVIPTIDVVVFPHAVVPLLILDEKIAKGVELAQQGSKKILLLAARPQTEGYQGPIGIQDLYKVGTVGNIMRVMQLPEGGIKILTQGVCRAHIEEIISDQDLLQARIIEDSLVRPSYNKQKLDAQMRSLLMFIEQLASAGRMFSPDFQVILSQIEDIEKVADFILSHLNLSVVDAQNLLERENLNDLIDGICEFLNNELEVSNVQKKISETTRNSINHSQREYYLREQIKAIQKELGEDVDNETNELREKIDKLPLTEEARTEAHRQFRRLEKTSPDSMEASVIRSHLEWLVNMPWGIQTKDILDLEHAKKILDENHYGLEDVKERILDYLSVRFLKEDCNTPILCLFGPPGVGKTSLGASIAECLGRKYFRISLGGVYDESEIRGHRRTYVGALPGRFIQAVKKSGSTNPLIIIDEIDKIGMSNRGDPSAALLEVLDPEQNATFYDNYLGVHFDLSKVMFITTANDLSTIPGPLRDRMEIIQISGYTPDEKMSIAQNHLIKKAIKNSGLEEKGFTLSEEAITEVINGYTRESGVRDLERQIQKLCAKYARALVQNKQSTIFSSTNIAEHLGPRRIPLETYLKANRIGVCNGLAWTPYGGEILQIETVLMPGTGKLLLTGQLGDVMKESAQAALTYAKSHAEMFGISPKVFTEFDLHIHVPAGAIPKDGPSAGISLLSSVLSACTKRAINGDFAMTGELNLQGLVLPIGGVKEKILAAKQNGLSTVILPKQNEKDTIGLDKVSAGIKIVFVDSVEEVLSHVLMPIITNG